MENEIRYYLNQIREAMKEPTEADAGRVPFVPKYIVTAVKLPTGAVELATNNENIAAKIDYILEAYDDNMKLKTNPEVEMMNLMVI